tara:strand:- start:191 stop:1024 length:834 start_codon:yes stop_codon:yes gene_type:complete
MLFKDFVFNYRSCLICVFKKKKYFIFLKRLVLLPYKYISSNLRDIFLNKNIDKIILNKNNKSLNEILKYFNCDKSNIVHGYDKFYLRELEKFKNFKMNILEFGIHNGSSQAAFCKYFDNSNIIGVDKNPYYKKFYSKKIRSLYCDVSDRNSLKNLKEYLKFEFDVIIDDASHMPEHQLKTFIEMFDMVKSKGIYVIEELDIFESFPEYYNKDFKVKTSEIRYFLHNFEKLDATKNDETIKNREILSLKKKIDWVKINRGDYIINGKNVSEIAFIKKK